MGTPDFAVPALETLHHSEHEVSLVVTQPDRPKGRGRKLAFSPVKAKAIELQYPISQPQSLRENFLCDELKKYQPDLLIVIAFGHILSKEILSIPRLGAINIHASLLPKFRGPAPIQWAIINGEKETGVMTMLMDSGLDTGDIIMTAREPIRAGDTAGDLHDRLSVLGAGLLLDTLSAFADDNIHPVPQDHSQATYAPLLKKKDGLINWANPADSIECFVRGMSPWPGAFTFHGSTRLKIFKAQPVSTDRNASPGTVLQGFPDELRIATGNGALSILEIQSASGKHLIINDFLRGYQISPGDTLG